MRREVQINPMHSWFPLSLLANNLFIVYVSMVKIRMNLLIFFATRIHGTREKKYLLSLLRCCWRFTVGADTLVLERGEEEEERERFVSAAAAAAVCVSEREREREERKPAEKPISTPATAKSDAEKESREDWIPSYDSHNSSAHSTSTIIERLPTVLRLRRCSVLGGE